MTNKEWLQNLSSEEMYDKIKQIERIGRGDINTRLFVIDWLNKEHSDESDVK